MEDGGGYFLVFGHGHCGKKIGRFERAGRVGVSVERELGGIK